MFRPNDLHPFLKEQGIFPKKRLSQNFLVDGNIIQKMIKAADITPQDILLEIGPGPGAITQALLATGATVIVVEKDPILAQSLHRLQTNDHRLTIICEDIMNIDLRSLLKPYHRLVKIIANLPFHLTTPILTSLLPYHDLFSRFILLVQHEVARRFTSQAGTKEYSAITLFLKYHSDPKYAFKVSRNCFFPKPSVDCAVVSFVLHVPPDVASEERFFEMTRTAFKQRRKMLRSSLRTLFSSQKITDALIKIGKNPEARAEDLTLNDFIALLDELT